MPAFQNDLLGFADIVARWKKAGADENSAIMLSIEQTKGLIKIVSDDQGWEGLQKIISAGRAKDAWLASDWPTGFDELVLCAPLCRLVEWECSMCTIGRRQQNISCANDNSLFGYAGVLAVSGEREKLLAHLEYVKDMLSSTVISWDPQTRDKAMNT